MITSCLDRSSALNGLATWRSLAAQLPYRPPLLPLVDTLLKCTWVRFSDDIQAAMSDGLAGEICSVLSVACLQVLSGILFDFSSLRTSSRCPLLACGTKGYWSPWHWSFQTRYSGHSCTQCDCHCCNCWNCCRKRDSIGDDEPSEESDDQRPNFNFTGGIHSTPEREPLLRTSSKQISHQPSPTATLSTNNAYGEARSGSKGS